MLSLTPYVIGYIAGTLLSAVAAAYAYRMRLSAGGRWLFAMLVSTAIWSLAEAFDYSSTTLSQHVVFAQLSYLGATTAPVLYLLFALEYCGIRRRVSAAQAGLLFVVPAVVTLAAFTNAEHHLVWPGFSLDPANPTLITYAHGPLYWLVTIYCLALALIASALLVGLAAHVRGVYRMQGLATLLAAVFPWVAELSYSIAPKMLPGFDPAITLSVTGAVLTGTMVHYRLLDLVPVSREVLVEEMLEGIVVLDDSDRLLEINPAAMRLLGLSTRPEPGTPVSGLFEGWLESSYEQLRDARYGTSSTLIAPNGVHVGVERSVLSGPDDRGRDLFMLRDITGQVHAEAALRSAYSDLAVRMHEIEELQHELREQATRDPVTGLHNRRYLAETLGRELARAEREGYPVSLVMFDADHFKEINDVCGHAGGDAVLRVIGAELRTSSRAGDINCRYGGDEFMIVLPNTEIEDALSRAERWRKELRAAMGAEVAGRCQTTISVGVASFPEDGSAMDELIAAADTAVYASKAAGRNRVTAAARAKHPKAQRA